MQRHSRRIAIFIFLILIFLLGSVGSAQEQTTVTLNFLNLAVGQSGVVEAEIDCAVEGCSAFAITITYDPATLQVDSAEVGLYLGEDFFVVENEIDPELGTVRLAAVVLGDLPETVESNLLFRLHVTALQLGGTMLQITDLEIGDDIGNAVESVGISAAVTVTGEAAPVTTPAPEETPELTPEATPEVELDPCWVRNDDPEAEIAIRVGPGFHRPPRAGFPFETDVFVVGQYEDDDGKIWWRIQPEDYIEAEGDRYWVAEEEVDEIGDCEEVMEVPASGFVRGTTPVSTSEPGSTPTGGITEGAVYEPVYACVEISDGNYQWYEANVVYDANGNVVEEEFVGGPYQGPWREGCGTCEWAQQGSCGKFAGMGPVAYCVPCELWCDCSGNCESRNCAVSNYPCSEIGGGRRCP